MKWTRDKATGLYHADNKRMAIRKDQARVWNTSRMATVVNWVLMLDGQDVKGYGTGYDTLAEAKKDAEKLAGVLL